MPATTTAVDAEALAAAAGQGDKGVSVPMAKPTCPELVSVTGTAASASIDKAGSTVSQIHEPLAGYRKAPKLSAASASLTPLQSPPAVAMCQTSSCDVGVQHTEGGLPSLAQRMTAVQPLADEPSESPILPKAPAASGPLLHSAQGLSPTVLMPATVPSALSPAMPGSIKDLIIMVNSQMGSRQLRHHITEAQAVHLKELFGDVKMLLDIMMVEEPLNDVMRFDMKLNPVQMLSIRRLLHTILHRQL